MGALLGSNVVRFAIVTVLGLCVDLLLAWSLAATGGVALPLAAFAGFCGGAAVNYVLHELWTFRAENTGISGRRGVLYALNMGLVLGCRVGAVAVLERFVFTGPSQVLPTLFLATAFSFCVNYLVSRHVVFRRSPRRAGFQEEQGQG